jgi:RHS repeat-associated protein
VLTVTPPGPVTHSTYTYDGLSRVSTYTDGKGSLTTYTYDNFDRRTQISYNSGGATVLYQYDLNGNTTQRNDGAGQTNWTYDGYNRVTKLAQSSNADLNYTYDNANNLSTEQGPAGTLAYSYDNANQIAGIHQSANGADETFVFTDGRPTTIYLPGSITETIGYDRAGRETSIKAVKGTTTLTNFTGSYVNGSGNDTALLQTESDGVAGTSSSYSYDGLNRLTGSAGTGTGSNSYTYAYDSDGNRTQTSRNGTYSAIFGFNAANELVTSGGATSGSYDQNANQLSTGTGLSFGYNNKNQTTSITPPASSTINASYLGTDQNGRTSFGATTEQNGLLGLYSDTTGSTASYFTHMASGTHQTLGEVVGGNAYYYLADLRGSTAAATDINGNVVSTYKYDPYGASTATTGSIANPYRFDGGYLDVPTGLYKFGERYYNNTDAKWTQLDPSGRNPGYIFAGDHPINLTDPTGMSFLSNAFDAATTFAGIAGAAIDGVTVGGALGVAAGCLGGAIALGTANGIYNAFTGEDPFSY